MQDENAQIQTAKKYIKPTPITWSGSSFNGTDGGLNLKSKIYSSFNSPTSGAGAEIDHSGADEEDQINDQDWEDSKDLEDDNADTGNGEHDLRPAGTIDVFPVVEEGIELNKAHRKGSDGEWRELLLYHRVHITCFDYFLANSRVLDKKTWEPKEPLRGYDEKTVENIAKAICGRLTHFKDLAKTETQEDDGGRKMIYFFYDEDAADEFFRTMNMVAEDICEAQGKPKEYLIGGEPRVGPRVHKNSRQKIPKSHWH